MKKASLIAWLLLLAAGVCVLFWYNDWKYRLPTPVPANYKSIHVGESVNIPVNFGLNNTTPIFLHFFNPACPCSRFNMTHFKSLVKKYGAETNFAIVVISNKNYTVKEIQDRFGIRLPVWFNKDIATACGVYSTPQAVIMDAGHKLIYRGNYNKSRYCADQSTEYARIALDSFLHHENQLVFDRFALKAYGCELPECTTKEK